MAIFFFHFFLALLLLTCWPPLCAPSSSASSSDSSSIRPELIEALLSESLRLHLVQACQGERVGLHCPRNTHISPQNSFFGRLVPSRDLCPGQGTQLGQHHEEDISCDFAEAHSRVQELCRAKRKCRLWVRPELFGERDPCPGTGKYLQIGYKCTPVSFEDQNFCEGQQTRLGCKQGQRLSIYSAHYGRTVNGQAMHCDSSGGGGRGRQPLQEDCVADVLPQIARRCHAQAFCSFPVDSRFLGSPCAVGVAKYLSVIFVCVNEEVFSEAALRGRLEAMDQLDKELNSLQRRNGSSSSTPTARHSQAQRHPLLGDQFSEESTEEEEEDNFGTGRKEEEKEWVQVPKPEEKKNEDGRPMVSSNGQPNASEEEPVEWPWMLTGQQEALPWLLLLLLFPCVVLPLTGCLLWQCRARLRERRERRLAEDRAAASSSSSKMGPAYHLAPDCSDGSSQRLLTAVEQFLPSPPAQSDIYHGCYVPGTMVGGGGSSSGNGSAYGGSAGGGYYATAHHQQQQHQQYQQYGEAPLAMWAQLRRLPAMHCYS